MGYYDTLTTEQKNNIAIIVDEAKNAGITNPNSIAGMLAIVSKESSFIPKSENLNYSSARLQEVFNIPASRANQIAGKPEETANAMYGGRYGNAENEGYKYRGRGFNQLTFKGNYKKYGNIIGQNLVSNPDKVNNVRTAAKVLIAYNKSQMKDLANRGKLKEYNSKDINDFKNTAKKDHLGGMTKALARVQSLIIAAAKKKPMKLILVSTILIVATWALIKYSGLGQKSKLIKTIT